MKRMSSEALELRDRCRSGLGHYLEQALAFIPAEESLRMMDAGCGSGVPTLVLARNIQGSILALDPDQLALNLLQEKVRQQALKNRISLLVSEFPPDPEASGAEGGFDLILAEGLFNIIGFSRGIKAAAALLNKGAWLILHDEWKNHAAKLDLMRSEDYRLIHHFVLGPEVWYREFYACMETALAQYRESEVIRLMHPLLEEIRLIREQPELFHSVYYIMQYGSGK